MREIRFRAWHKEEKFMATVTKMDWDEKLVETEWKTFAKDVKEAAKKGKHWLDTSLDNGKPFRNIRHFDEVILIGFTGLKDVNGKEIYEGDILEVKGQHLELSNSKIPTKRGYVKYCEKAEIAHEEAGTFLFYVTNLNVIANHPYTLHSAQNHKNGIKVIGNIYENPELLEVSE